MPAQSDLSIAGIDPNLLAQLQGLAGVGGLSNLFASSTSVVPTSASEMMLVAEDHHEEEYDTAVLALEVQLSNSDLLKYVSSPPSLQLGTNTQFRPRSDLASFVYQRLGLQCRQCGLRYFDSTNGQKSMDVHLDWHFTHKRRIREGAARAQGRSWFSNEEVRDSNLFPLSCLRGSDAGYVHRIGSTRTIRIFSSRTRTRRQVNPQNFVPLVRIVSCYSKNKFSPLQRLQSSPSLALSARRNSDKIGVKRMRNGCSTMQSRSKGSCVFLRFQFMIKS